MEIKYKVAAKSEDLIERIALDEHLESSTKECYMRNVNRMLKSLDEKNINATPEALCSYFSGRIEEKKIAQATARLYKSSIIYYLSTLASKRVDTGGGIDDLNKLYTLLRNVRTSQLPLRTDKTSSPKMKRFSNEIIVQLEKLSVVNNKFKNLPFVISFIKANLLTGLRPIEWIDTSFYNYIHKDFKSSHYKINIDNRYSSSPALCVKNAKTTHGRGNGEYRDIIFNDIDISSLAHIVHFKDLIDSALHRNPSPDKKKIAERLFHQAQETLRKALKKIGYGNNDKMPSLYSTRHQCVADAKNSGLNQTEIAALFGHWSPDTAKIHYGKKIHGINKLKISPSVESINAVKITKSKLENDNKLYPSSNHIDLAKDWMKN
ncbi:TPA: phage integrase N-terminal SAM-like domain-containing protein [Yersinia enterocolitica]|nr:phage integrase N-terminal SAM-like domain-containing protein [Yersinia enterocolitica]